MLHRVLPRPCPDLEDELACFSMVPHEAKLISLVRQCQTLLFTQPIHPFFCFVLFQPTFSYFKETGEGDTEELEGLILGGQITEWWCVPSSGIIICSIQMVVHGRQKHYICLNILESIQVNILRGCCWWQQQQQIKQLEKVPGILQHSQIF